MKLLKSLLSWPRHHWKLSVFLVVVIAGGIFWWQRAQAATEKDLIFAKPEVRSLTQTLDISGTIDAKEKARLRFISGGKVVYVGAKEGDPVQRYQTIATIDRASLQKQLDQDLNNYMKERLDWENTLDDNKDKALETAEVRTKNQEQLDLNNEVLDVEIRTIAIQNTVLSAPFDGILTVAPTSVTGVQLLAADYFEIVNPNSLYMRAQVDEADISKVQVGQIAKVQLDAFADEELYATVQRVAYTSTQSTNGTVFEVEFLLEPSYIWPQLRLGMNGDVAIILAEKDDVLTVPIIATIERDDQIFVEVQAEDGSIVERPISVGLETEEYFEVTAGLTADDLIVVPE